MAGDAEGHAVEIAGQIFRVAGDGEEILKTPWHFKLLVAITTVYLTYRLIQGLVWVAHQL